MTGLYDRDLIDALCRQVIGKPAAVCDWRDLVQVRDQVEAVLNGAVNAAQNPASTSPVGHQLERDRAGAKAGSAYPFPRVDPTCAGTRRQGAELGISSPPVAGTTPSIRTPIKGVASE